MSKLLFISMLVILLSYHDVSISAPAVLGNGHSWALGKAVDIYSGKTIYYESHYSNDGVNPDKVHYLSLDDKVIVTKELVWDETHYMPSFSQLDNRNGGSLRVLLEKDKIFVSYQENKDSMLVTKQLEMEGVVVIDAGFDNFVRLQWDRLVRGEKVDFQYVVPARHMLVELRAKQMSLKKCNSLVEKGVCFKVFTPNWLLRLFVKPLWLVYDAESKRLMSYEGVSNLNTKDGGSQSVKITYQYFD